jgi:8-oxo-dGTP pyrophosphatase MutT (NUDIX family)
MQERAAVISYRAGGAVVRDEKVLVIRVRAVEWELPKGGIEPGESPEQAALREVREETGLTSPLEIVRELGCLQYLDKHVRYFVMRAAELVEGPRPKRTRERRWIVLDEVETIPLVNESLRPLLRAALSTVDDPPRT